jgi:hypothetical protein
MRQVAFGGTGIQVSSLRDGDVVERAADGGVKYIIEERRRPKRTEREGEKSQDSSNG